jgi:hypothetical protein
MMPRQPKPRGRPAPLHHAWYGVRRVLARTDAAPNAAAPGRSPLPTAASLAADCLDPNWVPPPGPWPTLRPGAWMTIATDSLWLVRKVINDPRKLHISKHRPQLMAIRALLERAAELGATVHFLKVLSHTGLLGNDAADEAAVKTAKQETPVDVADASDSLALHSLYWITRAHASADGTTALRYASDRDNGLQKLLAQCPRVLRGDAPKTEKGKAWDAALPDLDGRLSNIYITSSSTDEWTRQNVLKMRHNCFYTARHKMLYGRGGNGKCPLCQNSKDPEGYLDSGPHILGGCPDPALSSLYVLRHDAAVKLIADTSTGTRTQES